MYIKLQYDLSRDRNKTINLSPQRNNMRSYIYICTSVLYQNRFIRPNKHVHIYNIHTIIISQTLNTRDICTRIIAFYDNCIVTRV